MYKQLIPEERNKEYSEYRINTLIFDSDDIGSRNKHFSYSHTEFCSFDKFLFSTWGIKKDTMNFGNALE